MAEFHFVEDYRRLVKNLMRSHAIDEAMALAVGGSYDFVGPIELSLLRYAGLRDGMSLVDIGCGSGRLSTALGNSNSKLNYLGTDIVQELLDYAATKAPEHFRFLLQNGLSVPVPDASVDMVCAFSVFTHLLHHETFLFIEDIHRALRPGGRLVFSFLEFSEPAHWEVFNGTVNAQRNSTHVHLNSFIERNAIEVWAQKLGFSIQEIIGAAEAVANAAPLGQSTAILCKL